MSDHNHNHHHHHHHHQHGDADLHSHKHFDDHAENWDKKDETQRLSTKAVEAIKTKGGLKLDPAATKLIDFGCGTGLLSEKLADTVHSIYGIDVSPNMIEVANRKAATLPELRGKFSAACLDIGQDDHFRTLLQTHENSTDLICSHLVFHHLPQVPLALSRLIQLLKPSEGRILITDIQNTPNAYDFHSAEAHKATVHHHGFTAQDFEDWLKAAGFVNVQVIQDAFEMEKKVGDSDQVKLQKFLMVIGRRP
ncbi:hypothetical protein HDV05_006536 [Chytridiales sp. JEL 0842]|nr:hypothetical protein HDV05_006536 [Chytridiales sp. JEL 0842]